MMTGAVVLRPAPGNAATAALLADAGVTARCCPLFAAHPVAWQPPSAADHDALLLTSANAVRHAGAGLRLLAGLPVLAVGEATAAAARGAGLTVALTVSGDAATLIDAAVAAGWRRPLHLAGRERRSLPGVAAVTVYAAEALPIPATEIVAWRDQVALLHSPRAARRFAALVDGAGLSRRAVGVAALSPAIAAAAGDGWGVVTVAASPRDAVLVAGVVALIDRSGPAADKRA